VGNSNKPLAAATTRQPASAGRHHLPGEPVR